MEMTENLTWNFLVPSLLPYHYTTANKAALEINQESVHSFQLKKQVLSLQQLTCQLLVVNELLPLNKKRWIIFCSTKIIKTLCEFQKKNMA